MKTLVIYDSAYGNTERIARSIGGAITGEVKVTQVGRLNPFNLEQVDFLFIGSPTQGGKPTKAIRDFVEAMPANALKGATVAPFDTRFSSKWASIFGYAASNIAQALKRKGVAIEVVPEGFFVKGKEGPLKEGEVERAASWAKETIASASWVRVEPG